MSVILEFPPSQLDGKAMRVSDRSAEVIIFPGVRFERKNFKTSKKITRVRKQRQAQQREEDLA